MVNKFSLSLFMLFLSCSLFAQKKLIQKSKHIRCYTVEAMKRAKERNPNAVSDIQFENWIQNKTIERKIKLQHVLGANTEMGTIVNYTLPIVFHVIHSGEAVGSGSNISKEIINRQVMQLNKDFANLSGSRYAAASKTGIQFALATKSPTGATLAEPGIDRVSYKTKSFTAPPYDDDANYITGTIKPATIWDPTKYLNIWVMDMSASGLLGFATFPTTTLLDGLDNSETNTDAGVVIETTSVGNVFSSSNCAYSTGYSLGRTLTHELGHFFGLRHIWGDSYCATDYCDDTPIHEDANYGKPAHPKPNSCGTADEMFENYMDYTDDQIVNTFTANQVDRIQTILANSSRRKTLATSGVATIAPIASNAVAFANCMGTLTIDETAPTGANRYKDFSLPINVENVATGNATLKFSVGGTAVKNFDYQLITPALNFSAGDVSKDLVIRIFDNNKVDGQRNITIAFAISGTGITTASSGQTMILTINDDDDVLVGQNSINLLNENFNTGSMPTGWTTSDDGFTTNSFVVGTNGSYQSTGGNAYVTGNASTKLNTYNSSTGYAILKTPEINATRVKSLGFLQFKYTVRGRTYNYNSTTGVTTGHYAYTKYNLSNDPNGNLLLFGSSSGRTGHGPYSNSSSAISNSVSLNASQLNNARFYVDFYWNIENSATANNPAFNVDDVVLSATPFSIETAAASSYSYNLINGGTYNFLSTNRNALAQIIDPDADVNNVTVSITEAGTDQPTLITSSGSFKRSRKVVAINNGSTNTARYTATIYFTTAELAAWGTKATGAKIIKVAPSTDLFGTINESNATLITPVVSDKRTSDGYVAYTFTTTGNGAFALVDSLTTLPVNLNSFTGSIENGNAILKWSTNTEINNSGFGIQRSNDGVSFASVGFVKANTTGIYSFADNTIKKGSKYYYRLAQTDINGKTTLSNTITLVYIDGNRIVSVAPNPFKNSFTIKNLGTERGVTAISITDINGRLVYQYPDFKAASLDVNTANWGKGTYLVRILAGGNVNTVKIVKD